MKPLSREPAADSRAAPYKVRTILPQASVFLLRRMILQGAFSAECKKVPFLLKAMLMQLIEIINAIEKIAPLAAAASWDLSGLQVAAARQEAAVLAVCLDPTPSSISKALELGAECILSHHPLLLKPVLPARLDAYHEVLRLLLTADVPLYAAHHLFRR